MTRELTRIRSVGGNHVKQRSVILFIRPEIKIAELEWN